MIWNFLDVGSLYLGFWDLGSWDDVEFGIVGSGIFLMLDFYPLEFWIWGIFDLGMMWNLDLEFSRCWIFIFWILGSWILG